MREIKFRGISIHGGFIYGYYLYSSIFSNTNDKLKHLIVDEKGNIKEIEEGTIGQYTGLRDKSGKEIFEGDIIKNDNGYKYEVFWHKLRLQWMMRCYTYKGDISDFEWYNGNNYHLLEIIGNIYENPDLVTIR